MKLTKLGHACVRLEKADRVLVIDPGTFSTEPQVWDGVDAILVTHHHDDHLDGERITQAKKENPALRIYSPQSVTDQLPDLDIQPVRHGDRFTAAGFDVQVFGEWHAPSHPDMPIAANTGFLVDDEVFHPGDSFTVPGVRIPTLLLPCDAPWLKGSEMVDFLRKIAPDRAYGIHDAGLSEVGFIVVDSWFEHEADRVGSEIRTLRSQESVDL